MSAYVQVNEAPTRAQSFRGPSKARDKQTKARTVGNKESYFGRKLCVLVFLPHSSLLSFFFFLFLASYEEYKIMYNMNEWAWMVMTYVHALVRRRHFIFFPIAQTGCSFRIWNAQWRRECEGRGYAFGFAGHQDGRGFLKQTAPLGSSDGKNLNWQNTT